MTQTQDDSDGVRGRLSREHVLVLAIVGVVLLASGAAAYSVMFTGGSGTAYETDSGLVVETGADHGLDGSNPFTADGEGVTIAGVTISAPGPANLTVDKFLAANTSVSSVDTNGTTITVTPENKNRIQLAGGVDSVTWSNVSIGGSPSLTYSASSSGTIVVDGLAADTDFAARTLDGETLTTGTTTSGGEASISVTAGTDRTIQLVTSEAPTLSNAHPKDTTITSLNDINLSIQVDDGDFAKAAGDNVSLTFRLDGSPIANKSVTQAQTVSVITDVPSGTFNWSVESTDSYGNTVSTQNFTVTSPASLEIKKEQHPTEFVDNVSVEISFYFGELSDNPLTISRSTSNGSINMTGLPIDRPFVVTAEADGYLNRRVFITSFTETQTVYLLNNTARHADVIFQLQDYSAQFPQADTVLQIQRVINGSWTTIVGDRFGANGQFPTQLDYNERHRLILVNVETNERRILGTYTPLTSTQETVIVGTAGTITIAERGPAATLSPAVTRLPAQSGTDLSTTVSAGSDELAIYTVEYVLVNGNATTTLANTSGSNPTGETLSASLNLSNHSGEELRVVFNYTEASGVSGSTIIKTYQIGSVYDSAPTLLEGLSQFVGLADPGTEGAMTAFLGLLIAVAVPVTLASFGRVSTELVGGISIATLAGLAILGWVSYQLVFVVVVGGGAMIFLRRRI